MSELFVRMSMRSKGLRYKLIVSFSLLILAILVFLGYLFPGVSSVFLNKANLSIVVVIVIFIVILGFINIILMIEPIIKITGEARKIAEGDLDREIKLTRQDEIGQLGIALNRMSKRIRENMEELKVFGEKTEIINTEINRRILVLSNLLQISHLISQNAQLHEIIDLGVEKCLSSGEMTLGCLILKDRQTNNFAVKSLRGVKQEELKEKGLLNLKIVLGAGILGKAFLKQEAVVIDKQTHATSEINELRKTFSIKNAIIMPIYTRDKAYGILITGNEKDNYVCTATDRELLELLSKQIAIAVENDILSAKVERLEITDSLTGLYNSLYIQERLEEEIKRAIRFQRPCAFVLFSIDRFKEYHEFYGHIASESVLIKFSSVIKENISEVDKVARFGDHEFALVLPEKNKRQSIEVADEIRRKVEFIFSEEEDEKKKLTCTAAVTENPVDGMKADDLITKARAVLESAGKQGGNKIYYKV